MADRYDLMKSSSQIDDGDNLLKETFPDPLTLEQDFNKKMKVREYILRPFEIKKFWLTNYKIYGDVSFDDILLNYNNIPYVTYLEAGDTLYLPNPKERF